MVEVLALVGSGISVLGLVVVAVITQSGNWRAKQIESERDEAAKALQDIRREA